MSCARPHGVRSLQDCPIIHRVFLNRFCASPVLCDNGHVHANQAGIKLVCMMHMVWVASFLVWSTNLRHCCTDSSVVSDLSVSSARSRLASVSFFQCAGNIDMC